MSETPVTSVATTAPEAKAAVPAAPEAPKVEAKPEITPEIQAMIDAAVTSRLDRERNKQAEKSKTEAERLSEVEKRLAERDAFALTTLIEKELTGTHDPAKFAAMVKAENPDLNVDDVAAVKAASEKFLSESPWAKADSGAATALVPSPGLGATGAVAQKFLTAAQMDALTPDALAKDDELYKLYTASRAALRNKG